MRFMSFVTSNHPGPPTPELMEAMGQLIEREMKAGRLVDTGGLTPLSKGAHVTLTKGKLTIIDGPFVEAKDVIGGYAVMGSRIGTRRSPPRSLSWSCTKNTCRTGRAGASSARSPGPTTTEPGASSAVTGPPTPAGPGRDQRALQ